MSPWHMIWIYSITSVSLSPYWYMYMDMSYSAVIVQELWLVDALEKMKILLGPVKSMAGVLLKEISKQSKKQQSIKTWKLWIQKMMTSCIVLPFQRAVAKKCWKLHNLHQKFHPIYQIQIFKVSTPYVFICHITSQCSELKTCAHVM